MDIQLLSGSMAFTTGAQVWLLPEAQDSIWSRQVDWYLNFILAKSERHSPPEINSDFQQLLSEEGLPTPEIIFQPKSPVMVATDRHLPANQVIRVTGSQDSKHWINSLRNIWNSLGKPNVRVFLPQKMNLDFFKEHWKSESDSLVQIVMAEPNTANQRK